MNIAEMLGTPVHDAEDPQFAETSGCASSPVATGKTVVPPQSHTGMIVAIAIAALAIGLGIGWLFANRLATSAALPPPANTTITVPPEVGNTAELFVTLYLAGADSPTSLHALYPGDTPPPNGTWVNHAAAVSGTVDRDGIWTIVVCVDSLEQVDGVYRPADLSWFAVPISTTGSAPTAVSAPSRIPPPQAATATPTFVEPVAPDQAAAVEGFLTSYLAATGEAMRYLAPTSIVALFPEAPYKSTAVTVGGADSMGRVRAEVVGTTRAGIEHRLVYTLSLSFETGVWEIVGLADGS